MAKKRRNVKIPMVTNVEVYDKDMYKKLGNGKVFWTVDVVLKKNGVWNLLSSIQKIVINRKVFKGRIKEEDGDGCGNGMVVLSDSINLANNGKSVTIWWND